MYLLVFTFFIVALIGIYAEVLGVQAARLAAQQSGIAQTMLTWHNAAVSLAQYVVHPSPSTPCSLTASLNSTVANCTTNIPGNANSKVTVTGGSYTSDGVHYYYPQIPSGYNTTIYQWNSIAYLMPPNNTLTVITYIPPNNTPPGFLTLATGSQIGLTASDLLQQLRNVGAPLVSYGYAQGNELITAAMSGGSSSMNVEYTLLPAGVVANGSVVLVSSGSVP